MYVRKETSRRAKKYGGEEDSYDDILNKVFDVMDGKRKRSSIIITDKTILHSRGIQTTDII